MKDIWTTKDGREIPIKDMSDRHLVNTLNMLNNKGFISHKTMMSYLSGSEPQGEMAQLAYEQECDAIFDAPVCEQMDALEEELEKRGLNLTTGG